MLSFHDNFVYRGKSERQKERNEYQNLIFPFGEEHRRRALALMRLLAAEKKSDSELLGIYITAKEEYLALPERDACALLQSLNRKVFLMPEERALVAAAVALDADIDNVDAFPALEAVRAKAAIL